MKTFADFVAQYGSSRAAYEAYLNGDMSASDEAEFENRYNIMVLLTVAMERLRKAIAVHRPEYRNCSHSDPWAAAASFGIPNFGNKP